MIPKPKEWQVGDLLGLSLLESTKWPQEYVMAHWVWTGAKVEKGQHPIMRVQKDIVTVRRVMYCLYCNDPEPKDVTYFKVICGHQACVNPTHFEPKPKLQSKPEDTLATVTAKAHLVSKPINDPEMEDLIVEVEREFGVNQPTDYSEFKSRPVFTDFTDSQVRQALLSIGLRLS